MNQLLLALALIIAVASPAFSEQKPAILFCSPQGVGAGWIDLQYLWELHDKGFEVDYTDSLADITADRIQRYNAVVLYVTPDGYEVALRNQPSSKEKVESFVAVIEKYVESGGGVLLFPHEQSIKKQYLQDLTDRWGAKLPLELIVETDKEKVGKLTNAAYEVPLAFTDQVLDSPVGAGVKGIWYPFREAYNAAQGGSIEVDSNWQVVVKASKTAETKPLDAKALQFQLPPGLLTRASVKEPTLFAIRSLKSGRIALVNQWPQFSVGSGVKWIYNREVLERGVNGKPSDFGKLLENTYRWLAEPSLQNKAAGGYVTKADTLVAPNRRDAARKEFEYTFWYWEDEVMQWHRPPKFAPVFRGLIGAKTSYSSGKGTVKEYADAARKAGLRFVVFLDDFDKLTPEEFATLKADCKKYSDEDLLLLGGFTMDANTGDHMFFYGPDGKWPPEEVRTGPNKTLYDLQPQDKDGKFTGYNGKSFDWLFEYHDQHGNIGYYNFNAAPKGQRISDLRCYGAAAIRYYKDGKLVEDMTDDYLLTAQGTIPPAPLSFNEVRSPDELVREVNSGNALTHVQARSVRNIFADGLWWPNQYQSYNTFPSDGPILHEWPHTVRIMTLGSEEFVTLPNAMASRIEVSAERGLKEISIYNGRELFRRFLLNGEKKFSETLLLNATLHKNLVLIATDTQGGKAVSFARRCWKEGGRVVVFCSDHVNDCKSGGMLLGHGPNIMLAHWVEPLPQDVAGATWDGGPPASLPLVGWQETRPVIETDKGREEGSRFNQKPLLDFCDEGAVGATSWQYQVFDESVLRVVNPWHTFAPIAGPSRLMEFRLRYREYHTPTIGVPESGWAGPGVRAGINACLFRGEVQFKEDATIQKLTLLHNNHAPKVAPVFLLIGRAPGTVEKVIPYSEPGKAEVVKLAPGDWFALYSEKIASSHLFVVREQPVQLNVWTPSVLTITSDLAGKQVKKGETFHFELFSIGIPIHVEVKDQAGITKRLAYLNEPTGMKIIRGKRVASPGFVECAPDNHAVEVIVPKPAEKTSLTLPLRVNSLNRRWTAGLFQKQGYVKGDYGKGHNRYRPLAVDDAGFAYVPMYVDLADTTHMLAGHPVVADEQGKELFIQVTRLYENPDQWHVSINNPTTGQIRTRLTQRMALPGLNFPTTTVTLKAGEYRVLVAQ
jgi:hypothetical protein